MSGVESSFVIASIEDMPAYDLTINGNPYTVTASSYYLWDSSVGKSLLDQVAGHMASEVTGANAYITEAGYVRLVATQNFTIVWTDTELRDLLGFTAGVGPTQNAIATLHSPLLWIPGWPETPSTPLGTHGHPIRDTVITASASGETAKFTTRTTRTVQKFTWRHVSSSKVWTVAELGGEYRKIFDAYLVQGQRFKLYSGSTYDGASSSEFAWDYVLGPYKLQDPEHRWYQREDQARDTHSPIEIACVKVGEYP